MQELTIEKGNALKAYSSADKSGKQLLEDLFGKKIFVPEKITDRINSFEDTCALTGEDPDDLKFKIGTSDEIAYKMLKVVVKAYNQDWIADYSNANQRKWYPWFEYKTGSGFRFLDADYAYAGTGTSGGSRLVFASEECASDAAKKFQHLYNQFLN